MLKLNIQLFAQDNMSDIFDAVNAVLDKVNVNDVTAESSEQFTSLPDGYYYTEVESAELTLSKNTKQPQVKWVMKNIEDGITMDDDDKLHYIRGSKNKKHFTYSSLKDERNVENFISDALKFEGEVKGKPYLEREYFTTAETLSDALELLIGKRIWLHVETTEKDDGTTSTWTRFVSFARANKLGLEKE